MGGRLERVGLSFSLSMHPIDRWVFDPACEPRYPVRMKTGGCWALGLLALVGCSRGTAETPPVEETEVAATADDLMEYGEEQIAADDPRARMRGALEKLGHEDQIPEDATQEQLQALVNDKVEKGLIPKEHAEKLMKVMETANARNDRLERLDQQLFSETTR